MKRNRIKKGIAGGVAVSVLAVWLALPNTAFAKEVIVEGRHIYTSFTGSSSSASTSISYTEGAGSVAASVKGYAYKLTNRDETTVVPASGGPNPTPGGASASVSAPSGYRFYAADSVCSYTVHINGATFSGDIADSLDL